MYAKGRYLFLAALAICLVFLLGRQSHHIEADDFVYTARSYIELLRDGKKAKPHLENWAGIDVTVLPPHYKYNKPDAHRIVRSLTTQNGEYFMIEFGDMLGYNANIIPHRTWKDAYIIVAQQMEHSVADSVWWAENVCIARFKNGTLKCDGNVAVLPISATFGMARDCPPEMKMLTLSVGPHDARVFYGPEKPYIIYGSNSNHPCMGMWIQDFRLLIDWGFDNKTWDEFKYGTEMGRPDAWSYMEKNWFVFWDKDNQTYVHNDLYPHRVYAKLDKDGSVGSNIALKAKGDIKCQEAYMPSKAKVLEGIHQATNSLSITLCERGTCIPNDENTLLFTLFHHKSYYAFHGNYEPYVMTFKRTFPFEIHGISSKPIWITGRTKAGIGNRPPWMVEGDVYDDRQSEMFYITSIAWATHGQRYHGFLDDPLFIAFGIEDKKTAGIDIRAGDLFLDLQLCSDL